VIKKKEAKLLCLPIQNTNLSWQQEKKRRGDEEKKRANPGGGGKAWRERFIFQLSVYSPSQIRRGKREKKEKHGETGGEKYNRFSLILWFLSSALGRGGGEKKRGEEEEGKREESSLYPLSYNSGSWVFTIKEGGRKTEKGEGEEQDDLF